MKTKLLPVDLEVCCDEEMDEIEYRILRQLFSLPNRDGILFLGGNWQYQALRRLGLVQMQAHERSSILFLLDPFEEDLNAITEGILPGLSLVGGCHFQVEQTLTLPGDRIALYVVRQP